MLTTPEGERGAFLVDLEHQRPAATLVLRSGEVPIGSLGAPLGSYLTVAGVRAKRPKQGVRTLRVEAVNGQRLQEPVEIWVDNLRLPEGNGCELRGYETARMIGSPPAAEQAAREAGAPFHPPQAGGWQLQLYFVALSAAEPADLRRP